MQNSLPFWLYIWSLYVICDCHDVIDFNQLQNSCYFMIYVDMLNEERNIPWESITNIVEVIKGVLFGSHRVLVVSARTHTQTHAHTNAVCSNSLHSKPFLTLHRDVCLQVKLDSLMRYTYILKHANKVI